jgi:hypothetical protein
LKDYRESLKQAIEATHGATNIVHLKTEPVKEVFQGKTAWEGDVEVFAITHPKASCCYAWGFKDSDKWHITTVLELPPVVSPETAVKVAIAAYARKAIPRL